MGVCFPRVSSPISGHAKSNRRNYQSTHTTRNGTCPVITTITHDWNVINFNVTLEWPIRNRPRRIVIDGTSTSRPPPPPLTPFYRRLFQASCLFLFPSFSSIFFLCLNIYVRVFSSFSIVLYTPPFSPLLSFSLSLSQRTHRYANDDSPRCNRCDRCNHDFVHRLQLARLRLPRLPYSPAWVIPRSKW